MKGRRVLQNAGWKDDEKIRLEPFPIDRARAGEFGLDENPLDVEDQLVADLDPEIFGDLLVERDRDGIARMIIDAPDPLAAADFFGVGELLAVGRSIFAFEFPLGSLPLRIEKNLGGAPPFHFGEPHGYDWRFLDDRHARSAHDFGHARSLVRLNVEEENVRLIVRAD